MFGWFKKKQPHQKSDPLISCYNTITKCVQDIEDVGFWFQENKDRNSEEIAIMLEHASSRTQALCSAILIQIRKEQEEAQRQRMSRHLSSVSKELTPQS